MAENIIAGMADDALLVLMVSEFQKNVSTADGYLGRTAIQKLCYFAQSTGVPFSFEFRIYYYGPYSEQLASQLNLLLSDDVLIDTSTDPDRYSKLQPGPKADDLIRANQDVVARHKDKIEDIASAFGKLGPNTLELLSTLHFIYRKFRASGTIHPSKKDVLDEFRRVKTGKFSDNTIDSGYEAMRSTGLLD